MTVVTEDRSPRSMSSILNFEKDNWFHFVKRSHRQWSWAYQSLVPYFVKRTQLLEVQLLWSRTYHCVAYKIVTYEIVTYEIVAYRILPLEQIMFFLVTAHFLGSMSAQKRGCKSCRNQPAYAQDDVALELYSLDSQFLGSIFAQKETIG